MPKTPDGEGIEPIQLDYASDSRRRRWRRRVIRAIIASVLIATVWAGYANRAEISLRARRWYWARQCLAHVTPPGTVLLEYDRSKVANNPDYMIDADPSVFALSYPSGSSGSVRLPNPPAGYMPQVWREYARLEPQSIAFDPAPSEPSPMIFLGERRTPRGQRRLVAISGGSVNALEIQNSISRLVLPVPGLFDRIVPAAGGVDVPQRSGRYIHTILEPGVADPNDPTHITIHFEIQAQSTEKPARKGVLDVYLDDGDLLDFKLRDPSVIEGL